MENLWRILADSLVFQHRRRRERNSREGWFDVGILVACQRLRNRKGFVTQRRREDELGGGVFFGVRDWVGLSWSRAEAQRECNRERIFGRRRGERGSDESTSAICDA